MYGRSSTSCTSNDGPPAATVVRLQLPSKSVVIPVDRTGDAEHTYDTKSAACSIESDYH